ncbi:MAG TPA: hypothetical protein VFZ25_12385 [Chloroflexota bacterium]|nr:hypothetical protein [Chloroflexota bacterium]
MANALWNVDDSLSTPDLVARIKASVRQHQENDGDPAKVPEPTASSQGSDGDATASTQAEVNETLLHSLDLVAHHLERLQTHVGLVDDWIREETEQSAQLHQEVSNQLGQLTRLVLDLNARITALEEHAEERKPHRILSWSRLAAISRSPEQG